MLEDLVRLKYTHKKAISLGLKSQPIVGREQGLKDVTFLFGFHICYLETSHKTDVESIYILKAILHGYYKSLKAYVGQQHHFSCTK